MQRKILDFSHSMDTDIFIDEGAKICAKIDDDLLKLKNIVDTDDVVRKIRDSCDFQSFK